MQGCGDPIKNSIGATLQTAGRIRLIWRKQLFPIALLYARLNSSVNTVDIYVPEKC